MQVLTRWLREQREIRGLSMRELGTRLGMPHSYVQKIELGERRLDVVEYLWYCRSLGIAAQDGLELMEDCIQSAALGGNATPWS